MDGARLAFYAVPALMIGRGSLYRVAARVGVDGRLAALDSLAARHPHIGERILIVGSGEMAVETAREALERRDAGYRLSVLRITTKSFGQEPDNPRVIGLTDDLVESLNAKRGSHRRGDGRAARQFPVEQLYS